MKALDRRRPFGTVSGIVGGAAYEQDGKLFRGDGTMIETVAQEEIEAPPVLIPSVFIPSVEAQIIDQSTTNTTEWTNVPAGDQEPQEFGGPPNEPAISPGKAYRCNLCTFETASEKGLKGHKSKMHRPGA